MKQKNRKTSQHKINLKANLLILSRNSFYWETRDSNTLPKSSVNGVEQQIKRCEWKFQATELTKTIPSMVRTIYYYSCNVTWTALTVLLGLQTVDQTAHSRYHHLKIPWWWKFDSQNAKQGQISKNLYRQKIHNYCLAVSQFTFSSLTTCILAEETDWNRPFLQLSNLRDLDRGSSRMAYRHVALIDLYLNTKFCSNRKIFVNKRMYA